MTPADFARSRHREQMRKGTRLPYIVHPEAVSEILSAHYPEKADLIAAGWLHDTVEDTPTTPDELELLFGPAVRRLVEAVTRRKGEAFHMPTDPDAVRLKSADALDNVRLTIAGLRNGEAVFERFRDGAAKTQYWRRIAEAAEVALGAEPLVKELLAAVREVETLDGR